MARYSGGPVTHRALSGPSGSSGGDEAERRELLYTLSCIREVRAKIDRNELGVVRRARELDISWTEIATGLGVSRQAAWERLRELDVASARE
jgi:DNA invertase Pin-like site-specific DNA recombinase